MPFRDCNITNHSGNNVFARFLTNRRILQRIDDAQNLTRNELQVIEHLCLLRHDKLKVNISAGTRTVKCKRYLPNVTCIETALY